MYCGLTEQQLDMISGRFSDHLVRPKHGRPRKDERKEIVWILENGVKWKGFPSEFRTSCSIRRAFQRWVKINAFKALLAKAGSMAEGGGGFKFFERYVNGVVLNIKGGSDGIGCALAGRSVENINHGGFPWTSGCRQRGGSANPHESSLVEPFIDFMVTVNFSEKPIDDKVYDFDILAQASTDQGAHMISLNRSKRKSENKTQNGRMQAMQIQASRDSEDAPLPSFRTTVACAFVGKNPTKCIKVFINLNVPFS